MIRRQTESTRTDTRLPYTTLFRSRIGEHGFEPLQSTGFSFAPIEGPFIEVALAVNDAEKCKAALVELGHQPIAVNHINETNHDEYLFGPDFHGLPVMVAFEGDHEADRKRVVEGKSG